MATEMGVAQVISVRGRHMFILRREYGSGSRLMHRTPVVMMGRRVSKHLNDPSLCE